MATKPTDSDALTMRHLERAYKASLLVYPFRVSDAILDAIDLLQRTTNTPTRI